MEYERFERENITEKHLSDLEYERFERENMTERVDRGKNVRTVSRRDELTITTEKRGRQAFTRKRYVALQWGTKLLVFS